MIAFPTCVGWLGDVGELLAHPLWLFSQVDLGVFITSLKLMVAVNGFLIGTYQFPQERTRLAPLRHHFGKASSYCLRFRASYKAVLGILSGLGLVELLANARFHSVMHGDQHACWRFGLQCGAAPSCTRLKYCSFCPLERISRQRDCQAITLRGWYRVTNGRTNTRRNGRADQARHWSN